MRLGVRRSFELPTLELPGYAAPAWRAMLAAALACVSAVARVLMLTVPLAMVALWIVGAVLIAWGMVEWWVEVSYSAPPGGGWLLHGGFH